MLGKCQGTRLSYAITTKLLLLKPQDLLFFLQSPTNQLSNLEQLQEFGRGEILVQHEAPLFRRQPHQRRHLFGAVIHKVQLGSFHLFFMVL